MSETPKASNAAFHGTVVEIGGAGAMARAYCVALVSGAQRTDKHASAPESARALSSHALALARYATR